MQINVINTNARSLRPKIKSFVEFFISLSLTLAIVTETWLAHSSRLESDTEFMLHGQGLAVHYLNRQLSANGVAHGGVAIILKNDTACGTPYHFPNPEKFEVLPIKVSVCSVEKK